MDPNAQAGVKDQISKLQREIKMLRHQLRQPGPEQPPNIPQKSGVNTRAKKVGPRQTQRVILHKPPVHNSTVTPEANVPAKYNDWPLGVDPSLFCYRYLVGFKIFAPNMPNTPVASIEDLQRYPVVLNPLVLTGVLITPELYDIVEPLNTPEARMAAIRQHPDSHLSLRSGDLVLWSVEFGAAEDGTVPKIYVRTDAAWYLLLDPVPEYQPLFRVLFDKCMLVQNMLDALVVEPRLSLTGPLNKFGIDFNQVKQHSTFLLHHIKSLNDDKINSSILVQELTRMAPPEQTLPPILPPGVFLLPQPNAQLPPGATPVVTPATPAVSESKFNLVSLPKPVYDNNNYSVPADPMPAAAPRAYPSIKLKTNTSYTPPTNGHSQPLNVTPVLPQSVVPQHVMPQHVPQHVPQPVMPQNIPQPVLSQPEPVAEAEQQTEHDTTHDELDFETGFDLEGVFVNDSQDDHHIEGLNASSYFSLS